MSYGNLTNVTLFASNAGTYGMVLGTLGAVERSISSSANGSNFSPYSGEYLDPGSNYSLYYSPGNLSGVGFVTANISDGNSNLHISLKNSNSTATYLVQRNGSVNVSIRTEPGNIYISLTGNYTVGQLFKYASTYLTMAGL